MSLKIGVIKGDGIGPEIVTEAMKVLDKAGEVYGFDCSYEQLLLGGASIDVHGVPLTDETVAKAKACDAVLMGSIGGDAKTSPWYKLEPSKRPEAGLLKIRKELNLFANLRPAVLYNELKGACPLKEEITEGGFDLMIMRELTGGLYFGERKTEEVDGVLTAFDSLTYNEDEIRRIAIRAFDIAMKRRKKVTSVDKANVLDSSRLWRKVVEEVAKDYPEVAVAAIREMMLAGGRCEYDDNGYIQKGVIVRHLILPGHTKNSIAVLDELYETYGKNLTISLMNQYTPLPQVRDVPDLNRRVTKREYEKVLDHALDLGITQGFFQEGGTAKESFIPLFDYEGL